MGLEKIKEKIKEKFWGTKFTQSVLNTHTVVV
jgi:hypothetical protein